MLFELSDMSEVATLTFVLFFLVVLLFVCACFGYACFRGGCLTSTLKNFSCSCGDWCGGSEEREGKGLRRGAGREDCLKKVLYYLTCCHCGGALSDDDYANKRDTERDPERGGPKVAAVVDPSASAPSSLPLLAVTLVA